MGTSYDEAIGRELLRIAGLWDGYANVDDRGVWPNRNTGFLDSTARDLLRWKPAWVFKDDANPPDLIATPGLPFPFDAEQLAAFLAGGIGMLVADFFGDWDNQRRPTAIREGSRSMQARRRYTHPSRASSPRPAMEHLPTYPPLAEERRTVLPTDCAAYHLNRSPQTLREWACLDRGLLRPIRIGNRLGWKTDEVRKLVAGVQV